MNNKYQASLQQKRLGKIAFDVESDMVHLLNMIKLIYSNINIYETQNSRQFSNTLALIREHIIKPNVLVDHYFTNMDILYLGAEEDRSSTHSYLIEKFLSQNEMLIDASGKSQKDLCNISDLTNHLPLIGNSLKPEMFLNFFSKAALVNDSFIKAIPNLSLILSEMDRNPDAACLFSIIHDRSDFFEECFKNKSDWRSLECAISILTSSISLYNNDAFTEKIVMLNREFYFEKQSEIKNTAENSPSIPSEVKGGSRGNSNKEICPIVVPEAFPNSDFTNSRSLKANMNLSIFLIKVVSMKMRDEIVGYVEKYLLKRNYYDQRYIIYFYEQIISKFSFEFYLRSGMLSNLLNLLISADISLKYQLFELCKRVYPFISHSNLLLDQFNEKTKELQDFLIANSKLSHKNSYKSLTSALNELEVFKANTHVMNFDNLLEEDKAKYEEVIALFEERNCFYLFTKTSEVKSPGHSYINESGKKYLIDSPNCKPLIYSSLSTKKRISNSFKGMMDAQLDDRPFSPPSIFKSSLGPIKTLSVKKVFGNSILGSSNKNQDSKKPLDSPNIDVLSKVKGSINHIRKSDILKPIKGIERLELLNLNINCSNGDLPKHSSSFKKYTLKAVSKQGSLTSIESKLTGIKHYSSNKTVSCRK